MNGRLELEKSPLYNAWVPMKGKHKTKPEVSWRAKLTPSAVRRIRKRYAEGWSQERLAEAFGVSQAAISMLLRGLTYQKVA